MARQDDRSSRPVWLGEDGRGWDHMRVHVALLRDWRLVPEKARGGKCSWCADKCRCPTKATVMAVYLGLVAHAELETGLARPGADLLADYTGVDERTCREAVTVLARFGWVRFTPRAGKAHMYELLRPPTIPPQPVDGAGDNAGGPRAGDPGSGGTPGLGPDRSGSGTRATPGLGPDEQEPQTRTIDDALAPLDAFDPKAMVAEARAALAKQMSLVFDGDDDPACH